MVAAFSRPARFARQDDDETDDGPSIEGMSLVWSPAILSRNGVRYIRCRSWRSATKKADMATFRKAKVDLDEAFVTQIADELVAVVNEVCGKGMFATVAPVACGHSRRPDCLSTRIAAAAATGLSAEFHRIFDNRFLTGSSHPLQYDRLPALTMQICPVAPVLVVDDAATSGFHIHEAVMRLRESGVPAVGAVWLSGVKR